LQRPSLFSLLSLHTVILRTAQPSRRGAFRLSFFDEGEETRVEPPPTERARRPAGTGRRTSGGGRRGPGSGRPPSDEQSIRVRRAVAAVALLVVVILVAVGVHSCQVSQANSALRDYSDSVASVIKDSNQTGAQFFTVLSSGQGSSNATNLQSQIDEARLSAENQLNRAAGLSVPDQVKGAHTNVLLTLQMRRDGIGQVARLIQPALQQSTATGAVNSIAAEMARLYASDVVYKDYALPAIVSALHTAGIPVGGTSGEPIETGQFVPDVQWLSPTFVATQLHTSFTPTAKNGKVAPGTHGHELNSVSVGGTTLQNGSTNTVPASPAPTFTLTFTNSGQNNETNVVCKVSVSNSNASGTATVPQTQAGQQTTCQVPLSSSPSPGSYTVTATVEPVPGEKTTSNNTQTFPVTFQ
jgi:hypothetical protein